MSPALTRSGLAATAAGAAFVLAGALLAAWPLLALGFVLLSLVMTLYLVFVPPASMLRRKNLELAWWVPPAKAAGGALTADRPVRLNLMLRNRSPFSLTLARMQIMASSSITLDDTPGPLPLPARREVRLRLRATPRSAGHWFFQGVLLSVTDRFGLFSLQLYYPNLLGIKVFPPLAVGREPIPFRPRTGASHERAGRRLLRQRGLGTDLREIRDHTPGDPFKRIAWKATARTRKLMVREFESEVLVTHWLLLDISSTMRSNRPGKAKLDYGLALCAAFARAALDAGDRVGLLTFDHRIYSQVPPGDGPVQLFRVVERLMELNNIVDEDLTDLTPPELHAAVATYLAYQEGVQVAVGGKLPRGMDAGDSGFLEGPRGQLYNTNKLARQLDKDIAAREGTMPASWRRDIVASDELDRKMRLFARLSGLEIPYRRHTPLISKERGMAEAIGRAGAARRSQFIVLVSDLEEISDPNLVLDALALCRRRGHSLLAVAPFAPEFFAQGDSEHARRVQNIFALRARRQRKELVGLMEQRSIPVLSAAPGDALPLLLRRVARLRAIRAGRPG